MHAPPIVVRFPDLPSVEIMPRRRRPTWQGFSAHALAALCVFAWGWLAAILAAAIVTLDVSAAASAIVAAGFAFYRRGGR